MLLLCLRTAAQDVHGEEDGVSVPGTELEPSTGQLLRDDDHPRDTLVTTAVRLGKGQPVVPERRQEVVELLGVVGTFVPLLDTLLRRFLVDHLAHGESQCVLVVSLVEVHVTIPLS